MVLSFLEDIGRALRRALGRALLAVWPVLLALLVVVVPFVRGSAGRWFLLVELALLLVFGLVALATDLDTPSVSEDEKTKTVTRLIGWATGISLVACVVAVVVNPAESEEAPSRPLAALILLLTAVIVVAPFVKDRYWRGRHRWRFLLVHLVLVAVTSALGFAYLNDQAAVDHAIWHWFVWTFFFLLLFAALLRLALYGWGSPFRIAAAAVALAEGARLFWLAFVGPAVVEFPNRIVDGGAAVLLVALVGLDAWKYPVLGGEGGIRRRLREASLAFAMLATTALTAACILATFGKTEVEIPASLQVDTADSPPALDYDALAATPRAFAAAFTPILLFPDEDRWEPIRADQFRDNARVRWPDRSSFPKGNLSGATCPSSIPSPCLTIFIGCPSSRNRDDNPDNDNCDKGPGFHRRGQASTARAPVYARVVDLRQRRDAASGQLRIARLGPYRDEVRWLIQYWYFYYYDDWTSQSLFGDVSQGHEADWEGVTIGFGPSGPLFVGFSAHCGGTWVPWEHVTVQRPATPGSQGGAHPVTVVGAGSQAMYPGTHAEVMPDWAACLPGGSAELSLLTVGLNIRENVGAKYVVRSQDADVELVSESTFPMNVPARWGAGNGEFRFESEFGKKMGGRPDSGPLTPTHQDHWARPLFRIFCTPAWHPQNHERATANECREKPAAASPAPP